MSERHKIRYVIACSSPSDKVPYGRLLSEELATEADAIKELQKIKVRDGEAAIFVRTSPQEQWMLFSVIED